jgi:hypothetical protein
MARSFDHSSCSSDGFRSFYNLTCKWSKIGGKMAVVITKRDIPMACVQCSGIEPVNEGDSFVRSVEWSKFDFSTRMAFWLLFSRVQCSGIEPVNEGDSFVWSVEQSKFDFSSRMAFWLLFCGLVSPKMDGRWGQLWCWSIGIGFRPIVRSIGRIGWSNRCQILSNPLVSTRCQHVLQCISAKSWNYAKRLSSRHTAFISTCRDESRIAIPHVGWKMHCKTTCDGSAMMFGEATFLWWVSWPSSVRVLMFRK